MPTPPTFSTSRREIAGVPVAELARRFGTPTFVYDAAKIRRAARRSGGVRRRPLRPEGLLEPGHPRSDAPARGAGRRGQRRRDPPGAGRRLRGRGRPAADRLHGRHLRRASRSTWCVEHEHPRQLRLARHDRPATAAVRPGREITLRINPGFGHGHSQKTNTGGEQSKHGIWHEQLARLPRAAPSSYGLTRHRPAHAHRLGHRPGAPCRRSAARWRRRPATVGPHARRRSAPAAACRCRIAKATTYVDLDGLLRPLGRRRASGSKTRSATRCGWRSSRAATWWPRAATWSPRSARSSSRATTLFYLLDAGFNNLARPILYGAYHPMSIVPADGDLRPARARGDRGRPAVRVGRHLHPGRRRLRRARDACPTAAVGDCLVIECAGAYGFVMGSNYNSKPAGRRGAHPGRPSRT